MKRSGAYFLVAGALLAACSGGGGSTIPASGSAASAPVGPSSPTSKKRGAAAFTIVIPKATAASVRRRPQYISAGTQSLVVALTAINGAPVGTPVAYAVNVGNAGCTTPNGVTTCTLVVPATAGNDAFAIATYDAAQTSANPTTPTGHRLSQQLTYVTIVANAPNAVSVPVTLNANVATLGLSVGPGYFWYGSQTIPIAIQPHDAAGDLIVGPGALLDGNGNPLTVTLADADTSATSLSGTSFTAGTLANATLAYTGGPLSSAALSASAPGIATANTTLTPHVKSGTLFAGTGNGVGVYDSSVSSPVLKSTIGSGQITGVAIDSTGNVYEDDNLHNNIRKYSPGSISLSATLIANGPGNLALNANQRLYAVTSAGIVYYDSGSTGSTSVPGTYFALVGVAVDHATQTLFAADQSNNAIYAYTSGISAQPVTIAAIYAAIGITGIACLPGGSILAADVFTGFIVSTPLATPASAAFINGLQFGAGVGVDSAGDAYFGDGNGVYRVSAGATTPVTASLLFSAPDNYGITQIAIAP